MQTQKNKGFTLIELLVTLAVAAIVIGIAAPSFNSQLQNNRALALGDELAAALNYARTEAVKQARKVTICASKNGTSCEGSWNEGFIVFVDAASADNAAPNTSSGILKAWNKGSHNAAITAKLSNNAAASYIRFNPLGSFAPPSNTITKAEIDIVLAGCKGKSAPKVMVSITGMVSTSRHDCPSSGN